MAIAQKQIIDGITRRHDLCMKLHRKSRCVRDTSKQRYRKKHAIQKKESTKERENGEQKKYGKTVPVKFRSTHCPRTLLECALCGNEKKNTIVLHIHKPV